MNIYAAIPLVSAIAYAPLIAITLRYTKGRVRLIFLAYLIMAVVWSITSFMLHAYVFSGDMRYWHEALLISHVSTWVLYYHFVRAATRQAAMRWVLYAGYGLLAMTTALVVSGFVIRNSYIQDGLLYYEITPIGYILSGAPPMAMLVATVVNLVQRYFKSDSYLERNRIVYLFFGLAMLLVFDFTNLSPALSKYPLDHIGNLANAIFITYAVVRYQLLDVKLIVRRGASYSTLTVGLTAMYLLSLFAIQRLFHTWSGYTTIGVAAALALLFAALFQPLREFIQRWIDRLFYRETYDYRQTLLTFSQRMSNVLNLNELADNMLYPITKALYTRRAMLLLPEEENGDFVSRFAEPDRESPASFRMKADSPLVSWLERKAAVLPRHVIGVMPEFKGLWQEELQQIDALELELFCPIRRKDRLIGVLVLSRRESEMSYSSEDIDLLTTMTTGAAMVIENAMILDNLRQQQRRVEQLLAQTVLAREEERRRISIELHDSVAQWLVGASFRVQTCRALLAGSGGADVQGELEGIRSTIDKSLKEIRQVISGLHPPALEELGLEHVLRRALEELKPAGIAYYLETLGQPTRLSASTELAVYRVAQEAIANVRNHSAAEAVKVTLRFEPDQVSIHVSDNGKGFDVPHAMRAALAAGHMGLFGMRERATMLRGNLAISSKPGKGTTVSLTLPAIPVAVPE